MSKQMPTIIGCGDIGRRVGRLYREAGKQTLAVVRSQKSYQRCKSGGLESHIMDLDDETRSWLNIQIYQQLFWFAPPPKLGELDTRLANALPQLSGRIKKIVLISTTGVYGDCSSEWVDENSPLQPRYNRAKRRLSAEQVLQAWANAQQVDWVILRVPGIYAANRLPETRIRQGLPIVHADESGWTNRIHADDLAKVCYLVMEDDSVKNDVFNVTDGNPSKMTDYFDEVADFLNFPRPPKITMQEAQETLSEGMLSYLKESRKISNQKLIDTLGMTLQYPSFQSFTEIGQKT